jgi:hypothetical protein
MSLTHPVFPPENNATTNLPTAFAQINTALRALDGADTLVIDAGATALETVLPRVPQVLAVHGAPGSLDGNGRYVLRLPSNGATDQILIVANRTASPLRLETADGANALVASLAAGRIEAFVLSGSTIGAYALSSTRTGKAATAHTHPASEITGLPAALRTEVRRASSQTDLTVADWHSVFFEQAVGSAGIGLTWNDSGRTLVLPNGVSKIRLTAAIQTNTASPAVEFSFSKNASSLTGGGAWGGFDGNIVAIAGTGSGMPRSYSTAWVPVVAGDFFRVIARRNGTGSIAVAAGSVTWISVEAL